MTEVEPEDVVENTNEIHVLSKDLIKEIGDEILDNFDKEVLYEMNQGGKKIKDLLGVVIFEARLLLASRRLSTIKFGEPQITDTEDYVLCKINAYDEVLGINHWGVKQQNRMETSKTSKWPARAPYEMAVTKAMRNGIRGLLPAALIKHLKRNGKIANPNSVYSAYDDTDDDYDMGGGGYSAPAKTSYTAPPKPAYNAPSGPAKPTTPAVNSEEKAKMMQLQKAAYEAQKAKGLVPKQINELIKEATGGRTGLFTEMSVSELQGYVDKLTTPVTATEAPVTATEAPVAVEATVTEPVVAATPEKTDKKTTAKTTVAKKSETAAAAPQPAANSEEVMSFLGGFDE